MDYIIRFQFTRIMQSFIHQTRKFSTQYIFFLMWQHPSDPGAQICRTFFLLTFFLPHWRSNSYLFYNFAPGFDVYQVFSACFLCHPLLAGSHKVIALESIISERQKDGDRAKFARSQRSVGSQQTPIQTARLRHQAIKLIPAIHRRLSTFFCRTHSRVCFLSWAPCIEHSTTSVSLALSQPG